MSNIIPRGSSTSPNSSSPNSPKTSDTGSDHFYGFLEDLGDSEKRKQAANIEQFRNNYTEWAEAFNLLKKHFGEVWELFNGIVTKVGGWKRFSKAAYEQ